MERCIFCGRLLHFWQYIKVQFGKIFTDVLKSVLFLLQTIAHSVLLLVHHDQQHPWKKSHLWKCQLPSIRRSFEVVIFEVISIEKIDDFNNDAMHWGWYLLPSWVWRFPRFDSCSFLIANCDHQFLNVVQIMISHLIAYSSGHFYLMDLQTDLSFPNRAAPDHDEWFRILHCWERLPAKDSQGSCEMWCITLKYWIICNTQNSR